MHFRVNNPGKGITTDLADICFLPIIDQFTNAQLLWQANKQTTIAKVHSVMLIHQMVEGSQSSLQITLGTDICKVNGNSFT